MTEATWNALPVAQRAALLRSTNRHLASLATVLARRAWQDLTQLQRAMLVGASTHR